MNGEQVLDHVLGLVDHFKRKRDDNDLSAGEAAVYPKVFSDPWSKGGRHEHEPDGVVVR